MASMTLAELGVADVPGIVHDTHAHLAVRKGVGRDLNVAWNLSPPMEAPLSSNPFETETTPATLLRKVGGVHNLNVTELQARLLELMSECSNEIAKSVNDWASSKSSQLSQSNTEVIKFSETLGHLSSVDSTNEIEDQPPLPDRAVTDSKLMEKTEKLTTAMRFTSEPSLRRSSRSSRQESRISNFSSNNSHKRRMRMFADTNVKSLFFEERKKEQSTHMIHLPSAEEAPIAQHKQIELAAKQTRLQGIARSRTYELVNSILILMNAVSICWETEVVGQRAQSDGFLTRQPDVFFSVLSYMFCMIFVSDLFLRGYAERWLLFTSTERFWNAFDVFVVLTMVLEVVSLSLQISNPSLQSVIAKFSMLRIVRLLRIVRVARVLKIVRFFRELRVLVFSILEAMSSLMWSVLLMFILFVMFGVLLHSGVMDYLDDTNSFRDELKVNLVAYFGTLTHTTKTLFQSISGGVDWGEPYAELQVLSLEYRWCFLVFILFSVFALLNVVTAVFVDGTIERTRKDRDFIMEVEIESKRDIIERLYDLFEEIDEDGDGGVTLGEFENYLRDESILTYFNALGLDIDTAWSLFLLLDTDESGIVNIEEFVLGCVRLKGTSRKLDVAVLKLEVENVCSSVRNLRDSVNALRAMVAEELAILKEQLLTLKSRPQPLLS